MYGFVLIAVLVVIGGVIAFIGDRVGSKVGKRKLSLFGLRPRHTSIIVTIVTGVCITTMTFIVLAAASENVRTALFGMEALNRDLSEKEQRLSEASQKLAAAQSEHRKASQDLERAKAQVSHMQGEQEKLEARATELEAGNAKLEATERALMTQNETLTKSNKDLEDRADALREGLQFVREGEIVFRAGEVIASGVIAGNRSLDDVHADMAVLVAQANRVSAERLGVHDERAEVWVFQTVYEQAAQEIAAGKTDAVIRIVAAGNLMRGEPVRTYLEVYENRVVYQAGEFIHAQGYKLHGQASKGAEQLVMSFLQEVNRAATKKGILPDPIRGSVGVVEGTQFYNLVQAIAQTRGEVVLRAYAREATEVLGPLRIDFALEVPDGTQVVENQ